MTHLVEMQEAQPKFDAAGLKLYAVSYDEAEALAEFQQAHNISYTLLSDPGSRVIRDYGILNTQIEEHHVPFYGIPYPGTYIVDEDGIIVEKFFNRHIAMRESADAFVDSALGELFASGTDIEATGGDDDISIRVRFHGGDSFKHGLQRKIVVDFDLADGLHIYGEPVPEGMVATEITIEGPPGLNAGDMVAPTTESLHLDALGVDLNVWSESVSFALPVWVSDPLAPLNSAETSHDAVDLKVRVRYQACDDQVCRIPKSETFDFHIPIEAASTPKFPVFKGNAGGTSMKTRKYFLQMVRRSFWHRPLHSLRMLWYLTSIARTARDKPNISGE